jgi:quinol-cytochrome oxidoreductase complex cytochrome b subunit
MSSAVYSWIDERLGVNDILAFAKKKTVPLHEHSFWYYWGGLSLFFFIIQALTGVLLLVYYRPGADAFESVRQITYQMQFGWLIRSAHSWSANLMIFCIFVHMFSVFFMKAYRKPREFGWFTGMGLLTVVMVFGFSGYLLPMDELAYFATKVGLQIPGSVPVIGPALADMVRGGPDVNEFTVQRFFALHVVVLPAVFLGLLGLHLWLVQKHGNAVPEAEAQKPAGERRVIPFFPNFLAKDLAMWLIALNVLAVMASLFPWDLGKPADALTAAPRGIHPEWYFMSPFQTLKWLGDWFPGALGEALGVGAFNVGIILWVLIPFYDGTTAAGRRGRLAHYFGLGVLSAVAITTIAGYWGVR